MLNEFKSWVESILGAGYAYSMGQWVETQATATRRYCVIQADGGPAPDVDDRRQRFRVILLGRRNERGDSSSLIDDANSIIEVAMGGQMPCGAANARAMGEVAGPGYTTENRAWCQVNFQVTL